MASLLTHPPSSIPVPTVSRSRHNRLKVWKSQNLPAISNSRRISVHRRSICYANTSPFEPSPITYAPENEETANIFESMNSSQELAKPSTTKTEPFIAQLQYLRKPLWLVGPAILLLTGVVPTLWLPISSIFMGPTIATLLSLTGLDCIFNLGASLFLLIADSTARTAQPCCNKPPHAYKFWNTLANVTGFLVPLLVLFCSRRGLLEPQLPFISFAVLLGPYFLLLSVQMLTEMLTWHWGSPVWLVAPVVYEAYRLLQLMRGLGLGVELAAPNWMVHTVRGLVCGWVLVLGVQLMRIAWYAGFTSSLASSSSVDDY
ncbi:hypothetical protein ABFS82_14G147900 [Erythranthe guttata]